MIVYWARKYVGQIKSGEHFAALKHVVSINMIGYKLIKDSDKYHTCFQIREKDHKKETARNFKAMELPDEQIAQGTGLSLSEVKKLKAGD